MLATDKANSPVYPQDVQEISRPVFDTEFTFKSSRGNDVAIFEEPRGDVSLLALVREGRHEKCSFIELGARYAFDIPVCQDCSPALPFLF